ncbi:TetR/AcrR family transcriptional regulator [Luteibacter aegosomatissinici]|uniref:TetR/AcrR family transcriptional regulator n=1 Tax=Luteibacter aegosomatissinici TaxID=2911539 RepID=UPI001FF7FAA0|nr:TetR/AcrR family transcriptional regulator [Luteibacter aegosomatissinici]UPG96060.1 TetR/AcrR family transcriptional regulator [Luteibacter aegosomatissinici]
MKKSTPYHHGNLRSALLTAAETILQRDGLAGLTLRAAAREAGVSHAAPAHHFRDLTGLLTELTADGYDRLAARLEAAGGEGPRRWDPARAYVAFGVENPALFQLMFQSDRLDNTNTHLIEARMRALGVLAGARAIPLENPTLDDLGKVVAGWSLVHGFTQLLLDRRLRGIERLAPEGTTPDDLLEAVFRSVDSAAIGPEGGSR